jgi:hypothetical protein
LLLFSGDLCLARCPAAFASALTWGWFVGTLLAAATGFALRAESVAQHWGEA